MKSMSTSAWNRIPISVHNLLWLAHTKYYTKYYTNYLPGKSLCVTDHLQHDGIRYMSQDNFLGHFCRRETISIKPPNLFFLTSKYCEGDPVCFQTPMSSANTSFLEGRWERSTINVAFRLTERGCFWHTHGLTCSFSKSIVRTISLDDKLFVPVRQMGRSLLPWRQSSDCGMCSLDDIVQ